MDMTDMGNPLELVAVLRAFGRVDESELVPVTLAVHDAADVIEMLVQERHGLRVVIADADATLVKRSVALEQERNEARKDCARFCGDNERLIKATGAETAYGALQWIANAKKKERC